MIVYESVKEAHESFVVYGKAPSTEEKVVIDILGHLMEKFTWIAKIISAGQKEFSKVFHALLVNLETTGR